MIIKNAKVYSDGCRFVEKDLIIRDGRIVFGAAPQAGEEVIDAGGAYALPGLVDIHFHGAVGHDFCDADEAGLQAIADFEASKGVLAICPATMTFSEEILNGIMDVAAAHKNERGADLVGQQMGQFVPAVAALIAAVHDERRAFAFHKITVALLGTRLACQIKFHAAASSPKIRNV